MLTRTCLSYTKLYETMFHLRGGSRTYVAYIRGCRCTSHKQLHAEFSAALQFPAYYGENPNALAECLEDMEWLNADKIYIVIDQAEHFLQFDQTEDNVYSRILEHAIEYWKEENQILHVFLNLSA